MEKTCIDQLSVLDAISILELLFQLPELNKKQIFDKSFENSLVFFIFNLGHRWLSGYKNKIKTK